MVVDVDERSNLGVLKYLLTGDLQTARPSARALRRYIDPRQPALVWVALPVPRCCGSAHEPDIHTLRGIHAHCALCGRVRTYARVGGRRVGWRGMPRIDRRSRSCSREFSLSILSPAARTARRAGSAICCM